MNLYLFTLLLLCSAVADDDSLHVLHRSGAGFDFLCNSLLCIVIISIYPELFMGGSRPHCAGYLWAVLFPGT